jgi:2-oxo-hept-3-ene-1,7-dioate hydratase
MGISVIARLGCLAALVMAPALAQAACPGPAAVAAYLADFRAARSSRGFGSALTLRDAACARHLLIEQLPTVLGPRVGYKAAFTNPVLQQRFGMAGPAWGAMFARGLHPSGARLPARFGAVPRYEADLLVVVKDAGLAEARTPLEALGSIEAVVPFIELPDLMLAGPVTGAGAIATNVGFRAGVLGPRVPVEPRQAFLDALASMTVLVRDQRSGRELGRARGDALMGHPIHAALWLARTLRQEGIALRPGDLLSLGAMLPAAPVQPGSRIGVEYRGLPGDPSVTVAFE